MYKNVLACDNMIGAATLSIKDWLSLYYRPHDQYGLYGFFSKFVPSFFMKTTIKFNILAKTMQEELILTVFFSWKER